MFDGEYEQVVAKEKAAECQLREAIRLFFELRDSISVHTLASAAHQILSDLSKKRGINTPIKAKAVSEKYREAWVAAIRAPTNFFKHAERDEETIRFRPLFTHFLLVDCTAMLEKISEHTFYEGTVYRLWFAVRYPSVVEDYETQKHFVDALAKWNIRADDNSFFLQMLNRTGDFAESRK